MKIRDRIKEFRRVPASQLAPHPKNWRTHPRRQSEALRAVLAEIGWADVVLARDTEQGLELIDGHLRAETAGDGEIPVLILDVDQQEADKILATLDPLAALAEADGEKLNSLLAGLDIDSGPLQAMLADVASKAGLALSGDGEADSAEAKLAEAHQVVIECESENEQREVFELVTALGHRCRLLTL